MTQHCCVQSCRHNKKTSTCTFKKFPSDPQRSKIWETLVRRSVGSRPGALEWKRSPYDRICECHFDDNQFESERQDGFFKLRWDAVPRLFGSRAKTPLHRSMKAKQTSVTAQPEVGRVEEDTPHRSRKESPTMSEEALLIDEDLREGEENESVEEDQLEYQDVPFSDETSNIASDVEAGSSVVEGIPETGDETERANISVIASTADAETKQDTEEAALGGNECLSNLADSASSEGLEPTENEAEAEINSIGQNEASLIYQPTEETEATVQYEATDDNEGNADDTIVENDGSADNEPHAYDEADDYDETEVDHVTNADDESVIAIKTNVEEEADAENEGNTEAEAVAENEENIDTFAENNEIAEEEAAAGNEGNTDVEAVTGIEENVEFETVADNEQNIDETDENYVPYDNGEEERGMMDCAEDADVYEEPENTEGTLPDDAAGEVQSPSVNDNVLMDAANLSESGVIGDAAEFSEGTEVSDVTESHVPSQDNISSDQLMVTDSGEEGLDQENFDDTATEEDQGQVVEECGGEAGEGDMDDDGEGEEFGGEEEEFEDGEEMGDEVEVEIEDCSDPEMESEGGVTYIISEGMIVVEENESSEAFHSPDNGSAIEEEHIICDDQIGSGQKTTRIVIKMPSSKSLSESETVVSSEQIPMQEAVLAKVVKPVQDENEPFSPESQEASGSTDGNNQLVDEAIVDGESDDIVSNELETDQLGESSESPGEEIEEINSVAETRDDIDQASETNAPSVEANAVPHEKDSKNTAEASAKNIEVSELANDTDDGSKQETVAGNVAETAASSLKENKIVSTPNGASSKDSVVSNPPTKLQEKVKSTHKISKSEDISKDSKLTTASSASGSMKSAGKASVKAHAPSKSETKVPRAANNSESHSPSKRNNSESSKEKHGASGSEPSKHSSKHSHSSSQKHKSQSRRTSVDEKTSSSSKTSSKPDTAPKEERGSKADPLKKQVESKDVGPHSSNTERNSKNMSHSKQSVTTGHRTRSNSTSSKEVSVKDKRSPRKDDTPAKKSLADESSNASKADGDPKAALRSSRSRKSQSDAASSIGKSPEPTPVKKEKIKATVETLPKQRQSERVSKATEKAIASGLISRRSRTSTVDTGNTNSVEKPQDSSSEDQLANQRRSKRKAESSPSVVKEETPVSKRRTTRSGEAQHSNETPETPVQSRVGRKGKGLKRKGSSTDLPPAKQVHTEVISPKDKVSDEFIANIPKMCRICGSNNDNLLNVFGPEGRTMQLAEKVHGILPIKIRKDEPLPTGVCHSCVVTLIACEKLVEKCTSLDGRLRAHFKCPGEKQPEENVDQAETASAQPPKSDKGVKLSKPLSPEPTTKTVEEPEPIAEEKAVSKPGHATRSSSRVSAKTKQPENATKTDEDVTKSAAKVVQPGKSTSKAISLQEPPATSKTNASGADVEDAPPVLEAEPPQSEVSASNQDQESSAQPPVLVAQPSKAKPAKPTKPAKSVVASTPAEDSSNAKRFGNTYRARMKPGQWEKIERGLEAIHGEGTEDEQETNSSDVKPLSGIQTEEFHIVDLDMNVEEVPPETPADSERSATEEFHIEIPSETAEEENAVQQSSPKSVIDSILVDWSGDEEDVTPMQKGNAVASERRLITVAVGKDSVNGSLQRKQPQSKAPCLFGEDDEGDAISQVKSKSIPVVIKQESFWPEPDPGTPTTSTSDKPQGEVPWKCFVCGKRGKSLTKFLDHKKLHLNDRKLVSCPKCSESFSNMGLLKSHMKAHHGDDDEDDVVEQKPKPNRQRITRQRESIVDIDLAPATDGLYHCSACQSAFASIESLCQHKLIHQRNEETEVYKCTVCRRTFFSHKEFQQHMATHQPSPPTTSLFQCAKCNMKMTNQKEFTDHIESHNSEQSNFSCDLCSKVFDTKHKLRSHRSTVHKSTAYACHLCDKVCQKRITLIEHLRKHTGDNPFACPVCNKRFNRLANYKAHMTIHENARRYECPYCGKRFNRQSIQQRHIKTHTTEQSRKHRCRVCNLTFGLATEMFTHRKLHTREEVERATWEDEKHRLALTTFPCKVCQMPFNTVEEVLSHMPLHTDEERDVAAKLKNPKLECDICGKVLNSKRTFNSHRSSHIDGKPFVCKICSKGYSTSTGLNYHMLSHTGERPFPCTFCHKGYKNSTDLKVHMRQHTGEFPYKCNKCNKAFRSASSLQKHGFVHTEVRAFKCSFCHLAFKRESTKFNHERIHTNDRRYKCKVCSRTFIQKGACDAHEKLHFRGGTQLFMTVGDGSAPQKQGDNSVNSEGVAGSSSKVDKHDLFEDFEEEDFDDDDDDEDEYIIYEDEDGVDDEEAEEAEEGAGEETAISSGTSQNEVSTKSLEKVDFDEPSKASNGVDLPVINITPVPVTMSTDAVPSVGDNSVHITIL